MSDFHRKDRVRRKTDGKIGTIHAFWAWGAWIVLWDDGTQAVVDKERLEKVDGGQS